MVTDLTTFKPTNPNDLLKELVTAATGAAADTWKSIKKQMKDQLSLIAKVSLDTAVVRAKERITDKQANHTLHLLEINFSAALMLIEILPFAVGEAIRNAVFKVINAVIKNYTTIDFGFGK